MLDSSDLGVVHVSYRFGLVTDTNQLITTSHRPQPLVRKANKRKVTESMAADSSLWPQRCSKSQKNDSNDITLSTDPAKRSTKPVVSPATATGDLLFRFSQLWYNALATSDSSVVRKVDVKERTEPSLSLSSSSSAVVSLEDAETVDGPPSNQRLSHKDVKELPTDAALRSHHGILEFRYKIST